MIPQEPNHHFEGYHYTHNGPSSLFKSHIDRLLPGKVLVPDDRKAKNSLYAASHGWDTYTFHIDDAVLSEVSTEVKSHQYDFHLSTGGYASVEYESESMDMIAFINADVPTYARHSYFHNLLKSLKKGGLALVETYHTDTNSPQSQPEYRMNEEMLEHLFRGFSSVVIRKVDEDETAEEGHQSHVYKVQLIGIK